MSPGGVGILEADVSFEIFVFRFVRCGLVEADTFDTVARHSDVVAFASQFKCVPFVRRFIGTGIDGCVPIQRAGTV